MHKKLKCVSTPLVTWWTLISSVSSCFHKNKITKCFFLQTGVAIVVLSFCDEFLHIYLTNVYFKQYSRKIWYCCHASWQSYRTVPMQVDKVMVCVIDLLFIKCLPRNYWDVWRKGKNRPKNLIYTFEIGHILELVQSLLISII